MASDEADELRAEEQPQHKGHLFHIKARTRSAIHVPVPQVIEGSDSKVTVTNWTDTDGLGEVHLGLFFDVRLNAPSQDDALTRASAASANAAAALAFAASAAIGPIEAVIIYGRDTGGSCEVLQYTELDLGPTARRQLKSDPLATLLSHLDTVPLEDRERLRTAMEWYRKAILDENQLDAFASAWLGLEVLNPILKRQHGLPIEAPTRTCPKCGEAVIVSPTSAGIRDLLVRSKDEQLWRDANQRRVALQHGTRPLSEVHEHLPDLVVDITNALRLGILDLIGVPTELHDSFARTPMPVPRRHRAKLRYRLRPIELDAVPVGQNYPSLVPKSYEGVRADDAGLTKEQGRSTWDQVNFSGQFEIYGFSIGVSRDPDDVDAKIEIGQVSVVPKD